MNQNQKRVLLSDESATTQAGATDADDAETTTRSYKWRLAVRQRDRLFLLRVSDIEYLEAAGNYVRIFTRSGDYLLRERIGDLEHTLDPKQFARIHRSTIVNLDRISEIRLENFGDGEVVLIGGKRLRMSRHYRGRIL